jgi:hypothetical protein
MKTIVEEKKSYWLACFTNNLSNMRKMACFVELIFFDEKKYLKKFEIERLVL